MVKSGSSSISRRHGFVDPDPDPYQNAMDPNAEKSTWSMVPYR
jgi:hypothetical protein